jgi:hypothetical protein
VELVLDKSPDNSIQFLFGRNGDFGNPMPKHKDDIGARTIQPD